MSRSASGRWSDRTVAVLLTGEVLLSLVLGFHALGRKSLWNDEGPSAMVSSSPWSSIMSRGNPADANARTPAMVGYHVVLKVWRVLGSDETVLRSLSQASYQTTAAAVVFDGGRHRPGLSSKHHIDERRNVCLLFFAQF